VRLLIAEDDDGLRSVLGRGLRESGYVVDAVDNGVMAQEHLRTYDYDVVILDWRMPRMDGMEVVAWLRRQGIGVPVLVLTARDTTADRVHGLEAGADDYLVKPFEFDELLARLHALQRRPATALPPVITVGDLAFSPGTMTVTANGGELDLTATELAILELLMRRAPGVVSRRSIAIHAWDDEADAVGSNTIDVHIGRLRAKLARTSASVVTVRGTGYRLAAP